MISVLHVTPHLGGGVGRVLLNHLAKVHPLGAELHTIACLEYANPQSLCRAAALGIHLEENMAYHIPMLFQMMEQVDVVVIHWWNHPLLYSLMVNETFPPVRLLIWAHVAGLFPTQNFTDALIAFPDLFVIATPHSFNAPAIMRLTQNEQDANIRLVFTCAGIEHVAAVEPRPHNDFRIGYVGTVDYCKMHPDYIQMNAGALIPDVRFVVCGGPNESAIRADAIQAGVGNRFEFLGHVDDVAGVLSSLDVFGYPLAAHHYGTGEQALIEALAAGVPPVVLANGAEQYIVKDGFTGIVAMNCEEYTHALELLYREPERRLILAENARDSARERFTIECLVQNWSKVYLEVLKMPKRARRWCAATKGSVKANGAELFIISLGEHSNDYIESMNFQSDLKVRAADDRVAHKEGLYRARTRGTVFHYQMFFPEDPFLNLWCGLMLNVDGARYEAQRYFNAAIRGLGVDRIACYMGKNDSAQVDTKNQSVL